MRRLKVLAAAALGTLLIGAADAKELTEVKVGLSAFQNVNSIYVGIAKGFYEQAGHQAFHPEHRLAERE